MQDLKLENVTPTLSVFQKSGVFSYGTDAVILAGFVKDFYKSMKNKAMCDLCSGTGIIPLMICDYNKDIKATGLEINTDACELAEMSAKKSGLSDRFTQICGDVKGVRSIFSGECFDFVTCNPPYMTADSGYMCADDYKTIARHEILCNIDDIFKAAFYLLPTGGNLFLVYRSDRLQSLFSAAISNRFQIKDMLTVTSEKLPAKSKLVLCRAMKDAFEGLKLSVSTVDKILSKGE